VAVAKMKRYQNLSSNGSSWIYIYNIYIYICIYVCMYDMYIYINSAAC
jgi:hypothetical protein